MKEWPKSPTKSILISLGLSFLFLLLAFCISQVFSVLQNEQNQVKRLERILAEKQKQLDHYVSHILYRDLDSLNSSEEEQEKLYQLFEKEGISILVYDHDTLSFWSSNAIPLDQIPVAGVSDNPVAYCQNGWYIIRRLNNEGKSCIGLSLIKSDYPYQNKHLDNKFRPEYRISEGVSITPDVTGQPVYSPAGVYLFSLVFPDKVSFTVTQVYILFILYLAALLFFTLALFQTYRRFRPILKTNMLMVLGFTLDVIIIRALIFYFKIPHAIYASGLFKPIYYGSSLLLPSLGDLVVNVMLMLFIIYAFYISVKPSLRAAKIQPVFRYLLSASYFLIIFLFLELVLYLFEGLILDSSLSLNLSNIFELSFSSFLGIAVMACLLICFFLASHKVFLWLYLYLRSFKMYLLLLLIAAGLFATICQLTPLRCHVVTLIFLIVYMVSLWIARRKRVSVISFYFASYFLLLFTVISTYTLYTFNQKKEKEQRKWMAVNLSIERDKMTEYLFAETENLILTDSILRTKLTGALQEDSLENEAILYIEERYLMPYRANYNYQVTICGTEQLLEVQPENYEVGCRDFFQGIVRQMGKPTVSSNLYFLDDGTDDINYLAILQFSDVFDNELVNIYIELYSKYVPKALGYPELLIDKKATVFTDLTNYSYAIYNKGMLSKSVGRYFYPINENELVAEPADLTFFDKDHYNHLLYIVSPGKKIIVSTAHDTLWGILSPFSYLVIFYGICLLVFLVLTVPSLRSRMSGSSFKFRLQIAITAIVLTSFLVIGVTSLVYLDNLNNRKNLDILSEKTHSVLIELEHKLANETELTPGISSYLNGLMSKFSQVFFSDINLYSTEGKLLASSRTEIFGEGLQSEQMNPLAFNKMVHQNRTIFIQEEKIGHYEFLSAYVPFRNNMDQTIAFLNLPYFARQTELRQEISTFLTAFININIILIAIAIFITLFVSNYITQPLQLIREKMRRIKLEKTNEKIQWPRKDEIGNLVDEYNRMIDELANSAELLARSERESAWREMAKQVAHEIKNPLTPMKLSIQYLQKAWDDKAPDWDQRLKKFTENIILQIDTLSLIATEFSDFAKMPQSHAEKIDLKAVIGHALGLYGDIQHIALLTDRMPEGPCYIYADPKQMLRVFNNLIRNSVQAIPSHQQGTIEVSVKHDANAYLVSVKDNGAGIPGELAPRIFTPSFTTKTGGMGMGLAIVKSIIVNTGGDIWFESSEGEGAVFSFHLPVFQEKP